MSKSRAQLAAIEKADAKRLAAVNGRTPATALRRLSAREIFAEANTRLQASRPVIGKNYGAYKRDKSGRKRYFNQPTPILGAPTFRNVIDSTGAWV